LGVPINWQRAIAPILSRRAAQLDTLPLPDNCGIANDFSALARHLKIRVREAGKTKIELTCRAHSIEFLDELLDPGVQQRIVQRGLDLSRLVADVRRRGYAPGPVFELTEGSKTVAVWLE
jgi:hypothetical protein